MEQAFEVTEAELAHLFRWSAEPRILIKVGAPHGQLLLDLENSGDVATGEELLRLRTSQ